MPAILMLHKEHGFTHAFSDLDIERLRVSGWRPTEESPPEKEEFKLEDVAELTIDQQYEKKFGVKPHHKMKIETIRKRLGYQD